MTSWRSIRGSVTLLDPSLITEDDVQKFFADNSIIGRGGISRENPAKFDFELAISGRKRRVATIDEVGDVFRGHDVQVVARMLHDELRKVEVVLDDEVILHGPIDIGAVDIDDEVVPVDPEPQVEGESGNETAGSEGGAENEDSDVIDVPEAEQEYEQLLPDAPLAFLTDLATSELPMMAKLENETIASIKCGELRLVVAERPMRITRRTFPAPEFYLGISAGTEEDSPRVLVHRGSRDMEWDWTGELPLLSWTAENPVAREFADGELGAAAVARLAVADLIDASFADVRAALLADPAEGPRKLANVLGMPPVVADVLEGKAEIRDIPDVRIFEPQGSAAAFEETLAWEVAGEGVVEPKVAKVYRELYLRRPWLVSMVAAAQAAGGGALIAHALSPRTGKGRSVWGAVLGSVIVGNALSRIATTQYVDTLVNRLVGDLDGHHEQ